MRESIRDRLAALSRRELLGLVAVVAVALAGVGLWYARSLPRPVQVATAGPVAAPVPGPTSSPSPSVIVVNVAGDVRHPGVFRFQQGDRVVDAIQAAGGAKKDAELDVLNLAALLTDAEQVFGLAALGGLALLAPRGADPGFDPLPRAGLAPGEPAAISSLGSARPPAARAPPALALATVLAFVVLGAAWAGLRTDRLHGSLLARLAGTQVRVAGELRADPGPGR